MHYSLIIKRTPWTGDKAHTTHYEVDGGWSGISAICLLLAWRCISVSQFNWHLVRLCCGATWRNWRKAEGKVRQKGKRAAEIKLFNCAIKCTFVTFCATSVPGSTKCRRVHRLRPRRNREWAESSRDRKFNCWDNNYIRTCAHARL